MNKLLLLLLLLLLLFNLILIQKEGFKLYSKKIKNTSKSPYSNLYGSNSFLLEEMCLNNLENIINVFVRKKGNISLQ